MTVTPLELRNSIPVDTPLGEGHAIILEAGPHDYLWTVILKNGAIVTFAQDRIRAQRCYTYRRGGITDAEMCHIIKPKKKRRP